MRPCINKEEQENSNLEHSFPGQCQRHHHQSFSFSEPQQPPHPRPSIADAGIQFPIILGLPAKCVPSETDVECICWLPQSGITQLRFLAPQRCLKHYAEVVAMRIHVANCFRDVSLCFIIKHPPSPSLPLFTSWLLVICDL